MRYALIVVLVLLLVPPTLAQAPRQALADSPSPERSPPATSLARTPEKKSPRSTGALQGTVRWNSAEVPQPTPMPAATALVGCGDLRALQDVSVSDQGGGIDNVILALVDVPAEAAPPPAPERLVLDNIDCRFSPHVAVLTAGSLLEMRNSDPILHLVHLYGPREANIAFPFKGMKVSRTIETAGVTIVKCDVHPWMQAFIRVDDHPFHAVTDRSGSFRIMDVPAGAHMLEAWHETLGTRQRTVRIVDGETTTITLDFPRRRRAAPHLDDREAQE